MKNGQTLALTFFLAVAVPAGNVLALAPLLTYKDLVSEARRYERLEGGERAIAGKVLFQKVRLDLKPFSSGSSDYFVVRRDEIGFVCKKVATGFKGGTIEATIVGHEEGAEGSHFYTLDACAAKK